MADVEKTISFVEYQLPRLKAGEYTVAAHLDAGVTGATVGYPAQRGFAVTGVRFKLAGNDLVSVFPPALSTQSDGVLPSVVLARPMLPWLRRCTDDESIPWLAVLTVDDGEMSPEAGSAVPVQTLEAADLVTEGVQISVAGAAPLSPPVTGRLPAGIVSYPGLESLDYGESPTDEVKAVDLPVALFSRIAPTCEDLAYLAHVRQTDTFDSVDSSDTILSRAVVIGNRMGKLGASATALLVSLEGMGDSFLPDDQGNPGSALSGATDIRLAVLASWRFSIDDSGEDLATLLENLDGDGLTTLRMPGAEVSAAAVDAALADEATSLSPADADVLVANALAAGFVPLDHHLREAGHTVSWYRGPLLPFAASPATLVVPAPGPDALLRYDPFVGMFDVSYAAAWQLGQLIGLRSRSYVIALYQWKKQVDKAAASAEELALLQQQLAPATGSSETAAPFASLFARRCAAAATPPPVPQAVTDFIGGLRLLNGVPFAYLVPDQGMLPPESLRLFSVDPNWIDALVDGAFSIGRCSADQLARDEAHMSALRPHSVAAARAARRNNRGRHAAAKLAAGGAPFQQLTGLLIRSAAVRSWPDLQIDGYSSADDSQPPDVAKLRMEHLSKDVLFCLFDGPVKMIAIHQPPHQLHSGLERAPRSDVWTTLRQVSGDTPGHQYEDDPAEGVGIASIPMRADGCTIRAAAGAAAIEAALNAAPYNQGLDGLTSDEFALELVQGVVRVEYVLGGGA